MRNGLLAFLFLVFASGVVAENQEKAQKKDLESQAKIILGEAKSLEVSGKLAEARVKYTESQALIEMKEAGEAIKRLDDEIHQKVKNALSQSGKLYEAHKYQEAASALEESAKLGSLAGAVSSNLALCYYRLGDRNKAVEMLDQAITDTSDPKRKLYLQVLLTFLITGYNGVMPTDDEKKRIAEFDRLVESVGFEASLEDKLGAEDETSFSDPHPAVPQVAEAPLLKANSSASRVSYSVVDHKTGMCTTLEQLKGDVAAGASAIYDRAICAEINQRPNEAIKSFQKYLELWPQALDVDAVRAHIAERQSLEALSGKNGSEVRRLHTSAYAYLVERKYDRALAAFNKAREVVPEFPLTYWKLGLMYEAMGDVEHASENLKHYAELAPNDAARSEANLHLSTLESKKSKYDDEVDSAEELLSDLFNRGMNLSFNLNKNRSALRARRARVQNKKQQNYSLIGGFAVPYPYAQQQLARAADHLQIALALFPLGAEANELMGLVFLQANDGRAAVKNFDAVASQGLPVPFYAELRGRKSDQAVKVELSHDRVRFIFLSSYDKNGNPTAPAKSAGDDGLGDLTLAPEDKRGEFDSIDLSLSDIKKVETHNGLLEIKLAKQEFALSPIYMPSFTPVQGPPARRFANNYTRLFIRYPGLENSKLGAENMTGGEKFSMGVNIVSSGLDIATSLNPLGAIQATMSAISIARTIHSAMASLKVSFAAWERSVDDQQQLLSGLSFKMIPTEPVSLVAFQQ